MLLEVKDLDISYGDKLTVTGASLELDKGEIMSIVGESGSWQNYRYPALLWVACLVLAALAAAASSLTARMYCKIPLMNGAKCMAVRCP